MNLLLVNLPKTLDLKQIDKDMQCFCEIERKKIVKVFPDGSKNVLVVPKNETQYFSFLLMEEEEEDVAEFMSSNGTLYTIVGLKPLHNCG